MRSDQEEALPLSHAGVIPPPPQRRFKSAVAVAVGAALAVSIGAAGVAYYNRRNEPAVAASAPPTGRRLLVPTTEEEIPTETTTIPTPGVDYDHTISEPPVLDLKKKDQQTTTKKMKASTIVIDAVPSLNPEDIPGPPPEDVGGSLIAAQFGADPYADADKMQMILDGELSLVDIRILPGSFSKELDGDMYENVWCDFCQMDWDLHRKDPSKYPSVRDIMGESRHCTEHRYSYPCADVMTAVRAHDVAESTIHAMLPTGILMHEGRAGATVVSNALAVAEPESTRVIAEHPAPLAAVAACDKIKNKHASDDCDPKKTVALLRDVVQLLSRTSDPNLTHLYLKMHASGSAYVDAIVEAFPDAKWAFFFRDADVALSKATQRKRNSCLKQQRSPTSALVSYATEKDVELRDVTGLEVCSMHLATLVKSALDVHEATGTGMLVDYDEQLKRGTDLVDTILPYLGVNTKTNGEARERVIEISKMNANARGHSAKTWSAKEEELIVEQEIKEASEKYVKADTMNIYRSRG